MNNKEKNTLLKKVLSLSLIIVLLGGGSNVWAHKSQTEYWSCAHKLQIGDYSSFKELSENEVEGIDYTYSYKDNLSSITVFTIHGGSIEKGTSEIVNALCSENKYNYYLFEGIKKENNLSLHITSTQFDESTALQMVEKSSNTVSIIGTQEKRPMVFVGGQNKLMARLVYLHLKVAGFKVTDDQRFIPSHNAGVSDINIVNKNKLIYNKYRLGGVQIGVSKGTRDILLSDEKMFGKFIDAIDDALSVSWPKAEEVIKKLEAID